MNHLIPFASEKQKDRHSSQGDVSSTALTRKFNVIHVRALKPATNCRQWNRRLVIFTIA
jgi:hypothetical protein